MRRILSKYLGYILATFTIIVWGGTFVATKELLVTFSPAEILLYRFVIAFIALFVFYPKVFKFTNLKTEFMFMLAGISGISLYQLMENTALTYTAASNVSIMCSLIPFFTAIISLFFFKDERISKMFIIGFIISLVGIVLVTFNGKINLKVNPLGDLISFGSIILWGFYSVIIRKITNAGYNMLQVTRRVTMYGIIFILPSFFISGGKVDFDLILNTNNTIWLLYLGVLASAICFTTWNIAIDKIGAVKTSIFTYGNPIVTIILASIILNEKITLMGLCGMIITIFGLVISILKKKNGSN